MTLGIRPEHIALSSQAEGGVPMVMDTLEILGADNWRTDAGASRSWWCDWRIRSARTAGSTLWLHLAENQLHLLMVKQDNEYE